MIEITQSLTKADRADPIGKRELTGRSFHQTGFYNHSFREDDRPNFISLNKKQCKLTKTNLRFTWILFSLEVGAFGSFLWHEFVISVSGWTEGLWLPALLALVFGSVLLGVVLFKGVMRLASQFASKTNGSQSQFLHELVLVLSPFLLLYFVYFQYFFFLKDIRHALFPISILGSLYLYLLFLKRLKNASPEKIGSGFAYLSRLYSQNPGRFGFCLFLLSLTIYVLLASGRIFPSHPLTGDEPHYLVVTQSLLQDGDLDVKNNYEQRGYLLFYPGGLDSHAKPTAKRPDRLYSRHLPGLPVLLLPFYYVGEKLFSPRSTHGEDEAQRRRKFILSVRLPLSVLTALLGLFFFKIAYDLNRNLGTALLVWSVFCFTAPVWFYSHLIYPEIPVALILIVIYWIIFRIQDYRSFSVLMAGSGLAILPWFGPKYIVLSGVVCVLVFWRLLKFLKNPWKKATLFLSPMFLSGCLFLFFMWSLYGNISPVSIYKGTLPDNIMGASFYLECNIAEFFYSGLGMFFDQRVGFLPYAPIYLLFIPGFILLRRKHKHDAFFLGLLLLIFWAFVSWSNVLSAYCPPGRHMLSIFWILALFAASALGQDHSRLGAVIKSIGIALSFVVVFLTLRDPRLLYHSPNILFEYKKAIYSQLLASLSNTFVDLRGLIPSFYDPKKIDWIPLAAWIIFTVLLAFIFLKKGKVQDQPQPLHSLVFHVSYVSVISVLVLVYIFFNIQLDDPVVFKEQDCVLYFQNENHYGKELDGFWTKGGQKASVLLYSADRLSSITVDLSSEISGTTSLSVDRFKSKVNRGRDRYHTASQTFLKPTGFPWKGGYFYAIDVYDSHEFVPFQRDRSVRDNRHLGVFVRIAVNR